MKNLRRRQFLLAASGLFLSSDLYAMETIASGVSKAGRLRVRALVDTFRTAYSVPGLSVAYSQKGVLTYVAAFGTSDAATGEPLNPDHCFRIASISKPITAAAIIRLIEQGALAADDRIFGSRGLLGRRFPIPSGASRKDWLEAISVDHLLTHTLGGWTRDNPDPMLSAPRLDHDALIRRTLVKAPLVTPPGTTYAYSNFGYCLLGRVIETVTGEPYADHVHRNILLPSGAGGMKISGNTRAERRNNEVAYLGQNSGDPYRVNIARMDSHGGWTATASELIHFALGIDGYNTVPDLLSRASIKLMATPSKASIWYGRGWILSPNHRNRWHTGGLPGTTTILVLVDGGACFAGLVNTRVGDGQVIRHALDTLMWDIYDQVIG